MDITELLAFSVKNKASDLHLSAGLPPIIRVNGDVRRINLPAMEHKDVHAMVYDIMSDLQRKQYEDTRECDFSFEIPNLARFRVNAFIQNRGAARGLPDHSVEGADARRPQLPEDLQGHLGLSTRHRTGHRADRFRQVDHPGGDDQSRQ
jgi:twitching motility protein PilT